MRGRNYSFLTQKERDVETGLDYFGYRYYGSTLGRWTSTDPLLDFKRNVSEPQAWNQYQYCINNPLNRTDPDGQQDSAELNMNRDIKDLLAGKITEQEFKDRYTARGVGAAVGGVIVAAYMYGPAVATAILTWASRNPDKVAQAAQMLQEAAGGPPTLVLAPNSRLKPTEMDSLTRLSKQLGSTLLESAHRGEEVVGVVAGTTKTIDVLGHSSFYTHPKFKMSELFSSIDRHVRKSADYTAIDLKGATKQQIAAITSYVSQLDKKFRDKIIYISP